LPIFVEYFFKRIVPDEYYLFSSSGYANCGRLIIAMAADYVTNVNFAFEQFATAAGIYAATNPLWPRITFQTCAVICVMSLFNVNDI